MSSAAYLLDTSALLTLIENELGAERVEQVLRTEAVIIPWMCSLEVMYITQQERSVAEAERRYAPLKALPVTHLWDLEEALLLTAAPLKATYRLSLADASGPARAGGRPAHRAPTARVHAPACRP